MSLSDIRKKIDQIDSKLVYYLNERAKCSLAVGKHKKVSKKSIYVPNREKEVLKRIFAMNKGPMSKDAFQAIYTEVMSSSIALEKALEIAYLGSEGSFTYMAAKKQFGSMVDYVGCNSLLEVFNKVEHGEVDYGVVPIENSTEGVVTHTIDLLVDSDLKICAQQLMKISQNLMAKCSLKNIKKIYSHPNVFGQCRKALSKLVPGVEEVWVASTTDAAERVAKEKNAAAIASPEAAKVYKLKILKGNIQDIANNTTRFFVISNQDVPQTGKDRTSILFSIKDKVGALHDMLVPFRKNKINMTKIESRPSKKKMWDYYFFVDFEGHRDEPKVKKALSELEDLCKYLKVLGSYPVL